MALATIIRIKSTPYTAVYLAASNGTDPTPVVIDYANDPGRLPELVAGPLHYEIAKWLGQLQRYNLDLARSPRIRIYRVGGLTGFQELEPQGAYTLVWVANGLQIMLPGDAGAEPDPPSNLLFEIRFIHSARR
jgi:hypothetical protein